MVCLLIYLDPDLIDRGKGELGKSLHCKQTWTGAGAKVKRLQVSSVSPLSLQKHVNVSGLVGRWTNNAVTTLNLRYKGWDFSN